MREPSIDEAFRFLYPLLPSLSLSFKVRSDLQWLERRCRRSWRHPEYKGPIRSSNCEWSTIARVHDEMLRPVIGYNTECTNIESKNETDLRKAHFFLLHLIVYTSAASLDPEVHLNMD